MARETVKYAQIAGELYFTWRAQQEVQKLGYALSDDQASLLESEFTSYLNTVNLTFDSFKKLGNYYYNVEAHVCQVAKGWVSAYGQKFNLINFMSAGRSQMSKEDFRLMFADGTSAGYSLKNYDSPRLGRLQVMSGTWATAICSLLFDRTGQGVYIYNGIKFDTKAANREKAKTAITAWAKENNCQETAILVAFERAIEINDFIKTKYTVDEWASILTDEVEAALTADNKTYGEEQINNMVAAIKSVPQKYLLNRFKIMTGFEGEHELLCLFNEEFYDSNTNKSLKKLVSDLQSDDLYINVWQHKKNLRFAAMIGEREVLKVDVPFTFNKNGAWHTGTEGRWCKKSNAFIEPNHRRPGKAKEFNSSTNTWVLLNEAIN